MPNERIPTKNSKYYLPKEMFLTAVHYCRQYPIWLAELDLVFDARQGIAYDKDKIQSSGSYDSTSSMGIQRAIMSRKLDLVTNTAKDIAGHHYKWLILGACYNLTYYQLRERGIPYGKNLYYQMRRKFFYELAHKI